MSSSRGLCALALVGVAACSFPDYTVVPPPSVGSDCNNGQRDGDEAGVDCGGDCEACPLCSDGMRNGDEDGVDCGGTCDACPTCADGKQNGSESDTDCGGACSRRCDTDERCLEAEDCLSLVCDRVCQPSDCHDGKRNGSETGADCGGSCVGCDNGSACKADDDCLSARCVEEICVDARCTDKVVNGAETDTDCGGAECAPCMAPGRCELDRDCVSKICGSSSTCAAPTCEDKVQNQDETWPDCGGTVCDPCELGESCVVASDCATKICFRGMCVPEQEMGRELSRSAWKFSSSESATESGTANLFDGNIDTHWSSGATQRAGMYVDVDLGKKTFFFKALVKELTAPIDQLPGYVDVYVSSDGNFGEPVIVPPVHGDQWTWLNFPTVQVGRYLRIQISEPKPHPWSIGEIYVKD
jgi:hypothetical protein